MNFGVFIPIVAILASAWVMVTYLHYHYRRGGAGRGDAAPSVEEARENARLARENEVLRLTIERLEERLSVLERIATDPAERTAREIEQLRHHS
jgi:hypothetical protein